LTIYLHYVNINRLYGRGIFYPSLRSGQILKKVINLVRTYIAKEKDIEKSWYIVDAKDKILGRLATRVASILRGKDKVIFSPHQDTGDEVIVINAKFIKTTGKKMTEKVYKSYSAYPGGLNLTTLETMLKKKPEYVIRHAVKGMLPKNKLGEKLIKKLKVYAGAEHPHAAQKPKVLTMA
jgi:large subunit ribosomal protein L13